MSADQTATPPKVKGTVFRVRGIPVSATVEDLSTVISSEFGGEGVALDTSKTTICPSCYGNRDKTAFIQFTPHSPSALNNLPNGDTYEIGFDSRIDISIDKDFYGLTQLYPTEGEIRADIVAVSGLNGHAYGSWRGRGNRKRMWLQDFFQDDFPNCRTMIYGFNSNLKSHSTHNISNFTEQFLEELMKARGSENEKARPIIFIGHSFGGIVIAHSLVKAKDYGGIYETLLSSTRITIFFGTPHRGLIVDDILNMLGDNTSREELVKSIQQQSKDLKADLARFIGCSTRFKIVSFVETSQTQKVKKSLDGTYSRKGEYAKTVEDESSMLQLPRTIEETLPAEGDHSTMVKFQQRGDLSYTSVVKYLKVFTLDDDIDVGKVAIGVEESYSTPYSAVIDKNASALKRILETKAVDTNRRYKGGKTTLLHMAADAGDEASVSILLKYEADTEAVDFENNTPLHLAARHGHTGVAKTLLKNGAETTTTCDGMTALHIAAQHGHKEVAMALLESGANIEEVAMIADLASGTALFLAAKHGHRELVVLLLANRADIKAPGTKNQQALHIAALERHEDIVEVLLKNEADVAVKSDDLSTPLHFGAQGGCEKVLRMLLGKGADIKARDKLQYTPLHRAASNGQEKAVEVLLKNGADIEARGEDQYTPLHTASCKGHKKVVEVLLKNGADIETRDEDQYTPLHTASWRGHEKVVEVLLKNGAGIETRGKEQHTPLHTASWKGHEKVVEVLLKNGADIETRGEEQYTPLHTVSWKGDEKMVEVLLKNGADIETRGDEQYTPLHTASWEGHEKVVEVLLKNGADIETRDEEQCTPLYTASWKGDEKMVGVLLKSGADTRTRNRNQYTPLRIALLKGHEKVVEVLPKDGADIKAGVNRSTRTKKFLGYF